MLIACAKCARQYDVGSRAPGSKIRCYCGTVATVPEPRVRTAPMQRCSSCGARLREGSQRCDYCSSEVSLGDRGWGDACPKCYARLVKGAAFCTSCGLRIEPHTLRKTEGSETCPRCETAMTVCEVGPQGTGGPTGGGGAGGGGAPFLECTTCGGVWLDETLFHEAVTDREGTGSVAAYFTGVRSKDAEERAGDIREAAVDTIRYLKCPVCDAVMNRKNFARASGIIVDHCGDHGFWLDAHEMEAILAFVESGGLEKARRHQVEKEKAELELARIRAMEARSRSAGGSAGATITLGGGGIGYGRSVSPAFGASLVGVVSAFLDVLTRD